jgi:hypothetical protein
MTWIDDLDYRLNIDDWNKDSAKRPFESLIGNVNRQSAISIGNSQSQSALGNHKIGNRQPAIANRF